MCIFVAMRGAKNLSVVVEFGGGSLLIGLPDY